MLFQSSSQVVLGLLAVAGMFSTVFCASLLSPLSAHDALAGMRQKRRVSPEMSLHNPLPHDGGGGGGGVWRPLPRVILLILRQKCQEWRDQGLLNLPSYCYVLPKSGNHVSPQDLNRFYDSYARATSAGDRLQDVQAAAANRFRLSDQDLAVPAI